MGALMERIRQDAHHRAIKMLVEEPVTQRLFGRWSMAYIQRDDLSEDLRRLHVNSVPELRSSVLEAMTRASQDLAADL